MSPRPDEQDRTNLRDLVAQAGQRRADGHDRVETEFWRSIDELQSRYHGAQQDIADVLGVKRNQVRVQTKRYRDQDQPAD
ncbi:hypothetical protein ACFWJY_00710 [Streptomyces anulatus]|uniref:hypothetical protein n=1 Tax=Streptomyces anulatus TaxID=1892 RepID=UPI003647D358